MTAEINAARRRELRQRAFAPGGRLTPEEAEELRMLSAPAPAPAPAFAPAPDEDSIEKPASAPEPTDVPEIEKPASAPEPTDVPEVEHSASRAQHRWLLPVVAALALLVGIGLGWLVAPRPNAPPHAVPSMNVIHNKITDELQESGDFDDGSVVFAGEQDGAAAWTATRGVEQCVILHVAERHRTKCLDPENAFTDVEVVSVQVPVERDSTSASISASAVRTLSGEWAVVIATWSVDQTDDWRSRYSKQELALIDDLQDDGFRADDLSIIGYDGDVVVWGSSAERECIAVVDPESREVHSSCTPSDAVGSEVTLELPFQDSIYSLNWSARRGAVLTIIRQPGTTTPVVCDVDAGACQVKEGSTGGTG